MPDTMSFPKTLDEFMEQYKIVDTEQVYTNGTELVPIFRIKQWEDAHRQQHERIFQEIVVEYPTHNTYSKYKGKPYFSINYTENGEEFNGFGTYKPEVLSEFLKEYFLPTEQPEDWMERNKERILQAGMEGREIEFRIGGRLFAIREKAQ